MLPGIAPVVGSSGPPAVEVSFTANGASPGTTVQTAKTISSMSFGAADASRAIFAFLISGPGPSSFSFGTITIGGVTATIHQSTVINQGGWYGWALVSAKVPTGTSGNIVVNHSTGVVSVSARLMRVIGRTGALALVDSSTDSTTLQPSATPWVLPIETTKGGFLIVATTLNPEPPSQWGITGGVDAVDTTDAVNLPVAWKSPTVADASHDVTFHRVDANAGRANMIALMASFE